MRFLRSTSTSQGSNGSDKTGTSIQSSGSTTDECNDSRGGGSNGGGGSEIVSNSLQWTWRMQSIYKIQHRVLCNCESNKKNVYDASNGSFKYRMSVVSPTPTSPTTPNTTEAAARSTAQTELYAIKVWNKSKLQKKDIATVSTKIALFRELRDMEHVLPLVEFFVSEQRGKQHNNKHHRPLPPTTPLTASIDVRFFHISNRSGGGIDLLQGLLECHKRNVKFTEKKARHIARSLLQTLHVLHTRHGIVHRNIQPETIYLIPTTAEIPNSDSNESRTTTATSIHIADFGLASRVPPSMIDEDGKDVAGLRTRCGVPAYCPPEMILGLPYRQPLDMWSIGSLLYTILGGRPPFQGQDMKTLFQRIRGADYTFHDPQWERISTPAKELIANLLTIKPHLRYSAHQALRCSWFKEMTDEVLAEHDLSLALDILEKNDRGIIRSVQWSSSDRYWYPDIEFPVHTPRDQSLPHPVPSVQSLPMSNWRSNAGDGRPGTIQKERFQDLYKLSQKIQSGSTGVVYQCRHKTSGEVFAVKIARRVQGIDEYLMYEVALMRSLSRHAKHIVKLHQFFEDRKFFYLVLDYMGGGDVFCRLLDNGKFTEEEARRLSLNMLQGIDAMHSEGIAHRDIKPQNLLISSKRGGITSGIKLSDFGFSRREHTPRSLVGTVGTPSYVAPEVLNEDTPYDKSCDLWSAGVTIYSILGGYPPFQAKDSEGLYAKIRDGKYEFDPEDWSEVSSDAKELIRNLLVVDPNQRWSAKDALRCKWLREIQQ